MADKWPLANGNWSDAANWNDGTKPTSGDDVFADGKTVAIDENVTVLSIRTTQRSGGTAGGGFTLNSGITVTANIIAGTTGVISRTSTGADSFIVGNITAGTGTSTTAVVLNTTASTTITGNVTGGSGTSTFGLSCSGGGAVVLNGNITGGTGGSGSRGVVGVNLTVNGNVTGGSGISAAGAANLGNVVINGNVSASSTAFGIEYFSSSVTPVTITGRVTSTSGAPAIYSGTNTCVVHLRGGYDTAANARHPFANATVRLHPTDAIRCDYRTYNTTTLADLSTRSLYSGGTNVGHPATSDVRSGTVFGGVSEYTGTLAVPSPTLVAIGVPTDNTVGSYAPTGGLDAAGVRAAVGLASANLDTQLSGIKTSADAALRPTTASRTLDVAADGSVTAVLDSAAQAQIDAIETLAARITTGIVQDGAVWQFTANMLELGPANAGGGDATLAKQEEILAAIQGSEVIQVASPNVSGNLVLTQGDDYDGTANPRAQWTVTTDYTSGWTVALTIRDVDDAVVYTTAGTVVSATVVAVTIAAPTGLTMTGCPGQWQGKFDVQLTHTATGKKKTIALGVCYINEDQTR